MNKTLHILGLQVLAEHRKPLHLEFHRPGVSDHSGEVKDSQKARAATELITCVLKINIHLFVSVLAPMKVNLLAFGVIICKVYRHTAVKKPEISHYENIR